MKTQVDEIAPDLFRLSTYIAKYDLQFNQFLVRDEEPLLFHTGMQGMFDLVRKSNYLASIPASLLPNALAMGLAELPVKGALWQATLGIAYRKAAHPSAPLAAFIGACRKFRLPTS